MNFQFATFEVILVVALAANAIDNFPAMAGSERRASISEVTQPPPGWVDFCARQPSECAGFTKARRHVALSWKAWMDLVRVNTSVNWAIKPLTDVETGEWSTDGPIPMMVTVIARTTSCSSGAC